MRFLWPAVLMLLALGCFDSFEVPHEVTYVEATAIPEPTPVTAEGLIGVATMHDDATVILKLASPQPDGTVAHSLLEYPPTHPDYAEILAHVGAVSPGEEVGVRPFPE